MPDQVAGAAVHHPFAIPMSSSGAVYASTMPIARIICPQAWYAHHQQTCRRYGKRSGRLGYSRHEFLLG